MPKVVLCTGMIRSGSTLQYQIVKSLVGDTNLDANTGYVANVDELKEKLNSHDSSNILVLKLHFFDDFIASLVAEESAKVVYSYRDSAEVVGSLMRKNGASFDECVKELERALTFKGKYLNLPGIYVGNYIDLVDALKSEIQKIARFLNIDISSGQLNKIAKKLSITEQLQTIKNQKYTNFEAPAGTKWAKKDKKTGTSVISYNEDTLLHKGHITQSNQKRATEFSPEETQRLERLLYDSDVKANPHLYGSAHQLTYSQNFEDIILDRVFRGKNDGFYIDVGAHDPDELSVTKKFYLRGWRGINIEPIPSSYEKFKTKRSRDINLNVAVSTRKGKLTIFQSNIESAPFSLGAAYSTFDKAIAKRNESEAGFTHNELIVPTMSLRSICQKYCNDREIDFLKIDVEGFEKKVLQSADFKKYRPKMIVIEATLPRTHALVAGYVDEDQPYHEWESIVLDANYTFVFFDGLNRYYLANECQQYRPLFDFSVNVFDGLDFSRLSSELEHEQQAHAAVQAELDHERQARSELKAELEHEQQAHAAVQAELEHEQQAHAAVQAELEGALVRSSKIQLEFREEKRAHAAECEAHALLRSEVASVQEKAITALSALRRQLQEKCDDYRKLTMAANAFAAEADRHFILRRYVKRMPTPEIPAKVTVPDVFKSIFEQEACKTSVTESPKSSAHQELKISIITPSFNSADFLERAIQSVLKQGYTNWEHIVVDGGSTDSTLEILKKYPHLRWISEPDRGQTHAMNKGFRMATGDVVSYLNADDYYLEDAFHSIVGAFTGETMAVFGKVSVYSEAEDSWWVNDPKTDFDSVLRHWEPNAFCVNPVGYFYRKEVQETIPYLEENGSKMDLAFLMELAYRYGKQTVKVDATLGVFMHSLGTQTVNEQSEEGYWVPENFPFIEPLLANMSEGYQKAYRKEQLEGYAQREEWGKKEIEQCKEADKAGVESSATVFFPSTEYDIFRSGQMDKVNHEQYSLTYGDTVIVSLGYGKNGSTSIIKAIDDAALPNKNSSLIPAYHLHYFGSKIPERHKSSPPPCILSGVAIRNVFDEYRNNFNWCFLYGVREPVSLLLSAYFENKFLTDGSPEIDDILRYSKAFYKWQQSFAKMYFEQLDIDLYARKFDSKKGYQIVTQDNITVLSYRLDQLDAVFTQAMDELLGVPDIKLVHANVGKQKTAVTHNGVSHAKAYADMKQNFRLDRNILSEIYAHKNVTHYFSEKEIQGFIEKWAAEK